MGSKVAVWKLVEPVGPCDSVRKYTSRRLEKGVDIHKLREEIASVGARVNSIDEQIDIIKAALPELENKIRYACLGMPMSSFPLDELQNLQAIHFKLLQFWEDLSRKQLEKLGCLSDCLQILEEQKGSNKSGLPEGIDNYKEIGQHISEKMQSDIRKNQELEVKLYFDRISCLPTKSSKHSSRVYSPPKTGPQQIRREQTGKEGVSIFSTPSRQWLSIPSTPILQPISIPSTPDLHQISAPSTPGLYRISRTSTPHRRIPSPSPAAHQQSASVHSCKEGATTPSTPVLENPSICNTIEV